MATPLRVLVVEDCEDDALLVTRELKRGGFEPYWERVETREAMAEALERGAWDLIISDFRMPSFTAADALALYLGRGLEAPFILVSGTIGEEQAVVSLKAGAHDFILKDRLTRLCPAVERELREAENRRARRQAEAEREASRAALARSEERFARLIELAPDAMVISRSSGEIVLINAAAERLFGYRREELLGRPVEDLFAENIRDGRRGLRANDLSNPQVRVLAPGQELFGRRKDGTEFAVEVALSPLDTDDGALVSSAIRDVSGRRELEASLRASAEALRLNALRLSVALSAIDMAVFSQSCDLVYEWIFRPQLGFLPADVVGRSDADLLPAEAARQTTELKRRAIETGAAAHGEVSVTRGEVTRHYDVVVEPVRDPSGRVTGITGASLDITARKQAEEAILKESAFSEALLDSLPGVFALFDESGRVLRWNRALESISGYGPEEIAVMRPVAFVAEEDRGSIEQQRERVFESGAADAEALLLSKDGTKTPYFFVGVRIVVDAAPCCIVTGIDISARRQLEAQLRQAQKIEAIGRLAGGVAHDFNNILGVIMGYGELAQRELGSGHPVRERVDLMLKAATRAAGLTRQLLAFSRKQVLQPKLLDLNAVVGDTNRLLSRLIGEDVTVVVRCAGGLGTVKADPGQVEQIIMNLAVNARDAMAKGGTLTLETANVDLDVGYAALHPAVTPGRYVMLAISDTGVGMDQATQARVFEPFFTTKPEGEGTGLGLATVYGIVKQSGGSVWLYSELGHGSTFKVYLPRVEEPPEANGREATPAAPGGQETILLVEDTEMLREVIREALEQIGYTVMTASNGEEALALVRQPGLLIDLLITDVVMPKLGGGDLGRLVTVLRPGIRVLFMSGYTHGAIAQLGVLGAGAALLEKPFTASKLALAVREVLDRAVD